MRRLGGIPLTTPARTLLDVAALLAFDDLVVAFADARQRQLLPDRDVAELLARSRGRRGAKTALLRTRPRARCDARCARVVVRVTWRQLIARQHAVVARIAAAIAIRS